MVRFPTVLLKCSPNKLCTVLNGLVTFLGRNSACSQKPTSKLKIPNINQKKMILRVSMTVSQWPRRVPEHLKIVFTMQSQNSINITGMISSNFSIHIPLMPRPRMDSPSGNYPKDLQPLSWSLTLKIFSIAHSSPQCLFLLPKYTRFPTPRASEMKKKDFYWANKPQRLKFQSMFPQMKRQKPSSKNQKTKRTKKKRKWKKPKSLLILLRRMKSNSTKNLWNWVQRLT